MSNILHPLIDKELAQELVAILQAQVNSKPQALGRGVATLAFALIACITSIDADAETKKDMVLEAIHLIRDLFNEGFELN